MTAAEGAVCKESLRTDHAQEKLALARINLSPHPAAWPGNRSGAFDLSSGDRFVYDIDGRHGWADEFLHDGEALVTFDDGEHATIKWNLMSPESPAATGEQK